ncbi:MAG: tyrosine recombinase [Clostridia bacterium]|nr:tyrosine recombinase [Clostridia bacterium]MEE1055028.1 tyrosine recombinase [Acutalibacteraceae bacterium]
MKDYIEIFKNYLTDVKKASDNTVESYMRDISQFSSYCSSLNVADLAVVDTAFLERYSEHLRSVGKSDSTVSRIAASLRCYYRYLVSGGIASSNPTEKLTVKKAEKKLPGVLTANEIVLLLSQTDGVDYKSIRDKAMLELLYATGIKVSELIELTVGDVNLQIGILHLNTGGKERIIPMYQGAVRSLANYLENVRPAIVLDSETDKLFTNMNGQHLSRQGFWKIIKHYADMAGIKKDITPHTLRHSFAAHLLENGAKLTDIKEMLGHSDISSTQVYARLMKSKYTSAYARFHPLAK